jgi:hypothetical protein
MQLWIAINIPKLVLSNNLLKQTIACCVVKLSVNPFILNRECANMEWHRAEHDSAAKVKNAI